MCWCAYLQQSKDLVGFSNGTPRSEACNIGKDDAHCWEDIRQWFGSSGTLAASSHVLGVALGHETLEFASVALFLVVFLILFAVAHEAIMVHFRKEGGDNGIGLCKLENKLFVSSVDEAIVAKEGRRDGNKGQRKEKCK